MLDSTTIEEFAALRREPSRWLPVALDIARAHGLPWARPHVFSTGTNLVVALDERLILKIFPPMLRHQFLSERAALSLLQGRLSIDVPEIVAEGERDGWPYLVMTRLQGMSGEDVWPGLDEAAKEGLLGRIGEVQSVSPGELLWLEPQWDAFLPRQIAGCRGRHERLGLPGKYLAELETYVRDAAPLIPREFSPVILTGEYIPENFILSPASEGWRLSGLIDFGDVMTGWGEYDLLGPGGFMAEGKPGRVRSLLRGFGYPETKMDRTLSRRLFVLSLLHRFSDPMRQIRIEGWQQKTDNLAELERLLWPLE